VSITITIRLPVREKGSIMDHLFDEFSKSLAESVPSRESLRRLGAVLAGAVLSPLGVGTAWAGHWGHSPQYLGPFCIHHAR
jgi:hypothetical protein